MAPRLDIIDIILGGGSSRARPRGLFDELAERLAGGRYASGGYVRQPSAEDFIAALLSPPTVAEQYAIMDEAIDHLIKSGTAKALQPVTKRSRVQISDNVLFIGPEGFPEDHPHHNFLIRHTDPKKRDRWRLYSICPRHNRSRGFHIKGIEDMAEAEHVANLVMDIGLHLIPEEALAAATRKPKPAAAAAPMPEAPAAKE